jgi:multidrug efflux pump subunit AcrB
MWLVHAALRRPLTILVLAFAVLAGAALSLRRAPADIFPNLGVPVIYVVQPYAGMSATQMEGQLVYYYEYHFLYIAGIEHVESQSVQGIGMLKLYFHPGTDIAQAMAQVTAMTFRATAFMPPGTLPAFIVRYDAGSVPIGQLVFSSDQRSESEIQDLALNRVRPVLATLPGASAPPPAGGKVRTIVAYLDPERLRAYGMSPDDVATAIARANLTLPAGNVRIGDFNTVAATNAMVARPAELADVPLRTGPGPTVYVRDVARVEDGADVVYNIALANGRRTVYMPLTKRADASTLDVVRAFREALPRMRALVPPDVHIDLEFDQSTYVTNSIRGLVTEGALGALLTALVVLLFLRNWRAAIIVVVTIPLSILTAAIALRLVGQTVNIMTLSGLSLAVGILVDESTVAIENIHTHLDRETDTGRAVLHAMREVLVPRLLAMFCVLAVFIPSFSMVGISRSLFPPLALAVGFAMIASYLFSSTLVPVLSIWFFRGKRGAHAKADAQSEGVARRFYSRVVAFAIRFRWALVAVYLVVCASVVVLARGLPTELFPSVDTGQFQMRIRARPGTRLERTEQIVRDIEEVIRHEVGEGRVRTTLANIGPPAWNFPVNAVYTFNTGPHEATLLVALERADRHHPRPRIEVLQERLRRRLAERFPDVRVSFEAGDIVSQVMNFGAPTPINVTVASKTIPEARRFAQRVAERLARLPHLRDVQIPEALDVPSLDVAIDRERAGQFGVTVDRVGHSIVDATSSSVITTPNFWTDPRTGLPYRVAVQVPEQQVASAEDLSNLPVAPNGASRPLLSDIASVTPGTTAGEIDRYNGQRTVSVTANLVGGDLARAASDVERAIRDAGPLPRGVTATIHGQAEQMRTTLEGLREGLGLAVLAVFLLLTANYQSLREPLVVLSTTPAVIAGVIVSLRLTGTSLNVQSMMGAVMSIGVSVANAVLLVTFARERWFAGDEQRAAVARAANARVRPIVMTSLAMVMGMVPTALAFGEGSEQAAPLGRAVIGGLLASTIATLLFVPAIYAVLARKGAAKSASLDPTDDGRTRDREPLPAGAAE